MQGCTTVKVGRKSVKLVDSKAKFVKLVPTVKTALPALKNSEVSLQGVKSAKLRKRLASFKVKGVKRVRVVYTLSASSEGYQVTTKRNAWLKIR